MTPGSISPLWKNSALFRRVLLNRCCPEVRTLVTCRTALFPYSLFTIAYFCFRILKQNPTIRRLISFFLLLVFLVTAVPKAYFHDLVADHKDTITTCNHGNHSSACIHESAINCHFDQLVVSSFFFFAHKPFIATPPAIQDCPFAGIPTVHLVSVFYITESRGPPAA
jgi:hypothetical protein